MAVALVIGVGSAGLAILIARELRQAEERERVGLMESVLCRGGACDVESGLI